jgi:hypothetical protein
MDDIGGGLWRNFAYGAENDWPPAFPRFERPKYLARLADGRGIMWKFVGLHAPNPATSVAGPQAESKHTIKPLNSILNVHGFEATPWIEGNRFSPENLDDDLLVLLCEYIGSSSQPPLDSDSNLESLERLSNMLLCNTGELLGDRAVEEAAKICASVRSLLEVSGFPSYGDGRMAPWEFIRASNGLIWKADHSGHQFDHTIVGRQSVLWDVAGLLVEWRSSQYRTQQVIERIRRDFGHYDTRALQFYCAAYAAFRAGMADLCAATAADSGSSHLEKARDFYKSALAESLGTFSQ